MALRLKHLWRLGTELFAASVLTNSWWMLPMIVVLAVTALAATVVQIVVPVGVYTLI